MTIHLFCQYLGSRASLTMCGAKVEDRAVCSEVLWEIVDFERRCEACATQLSRSKIAWAIVGETR